MRSIGSRSASPSCIWPSPFTIRGRTKKSIRLEELGGQAYVGLKPSCALSYTVETLLAGAGVEPETLYRADELDMVAGLVSAGFGVSLLPKTLGVRNYPMAWVHVTDPASELTVGAVWKKDRQLTPVCEVFLDFIRERYGSGTAE
ncbi:LysR substrate-binding domain-containing protein [Cohnella ginsengisoli]|uniref:LysR substrate-binding domain-containing protein n=1 Tax=Cohnella ginsengisoli TaxID=425004 RepID=UPI003B8A6206